MCFRAKILQTDLLEKADGRRHREQGRWIVSPVPCELIFPTRWTTAEAPAPTRDQRPKPRLMSFRDVEKAAAERRTQPLVEARTVEVAVERRDVHVDHRGGVRTVDA